MDENNCPNRPNTISAITSYRLFNQANIAREALSRQIIEKYRKSNTFDEMEEQTNDDSTIIARKIDL
jgi:hypothetical protein